MMYDPLYLLFTLPAMALSALASFLVNSTFKRFAGVGSASRMTGAQAARRMMQFGGVSDVQIEQIQTFLGDHYDPSSKVLRLSPDVYGGTSLSSIGVACHEAGHALQHAQKYAPLVLRSALVPAANLGSRLGYWVLMGGMALYAVTTSASTGTSAASKPGFATMLIMAGIGLMSLAVIFSIVTLPVEWDASARARRLMVDCGIVSDSEASNARKVLNAAFMTYIAAAVSGVMNILYFLLRTGLLGGRRRD